MKTTSGLGRVFLTACAAILLCSCGEPNKIEPTTPAAPTDLLAGDITDSSATLSWNGDNATYEVIIAKIDNAESSSSEVVGDAKAAAPTAMPMPVTGKSYTAVGLTPETEYAWKVRTVDGNKTSGWIDGKPFKTAASNDKNPDTPTSLSVSHITDVSARFMWRGDGDSYEVSIGNKTAIVDFKIYTATDLTPETEYTWKVRAVDGGKTSGWVDGEPFVTEKSTGGEYTHTFVNADFTCFVNKDTYLKNYNLWLYDADYMESGGSGTALVMDLYAPGDSKRIIPDGTYAAGGTEAWQINAPYSFMQTSKGLIEKDQLASGTVAITLKETGTDTYTIVVDLLTKSGVAIKTTYSGKAGYYKI